MSGPLGILGLVIFGVISTVGLLGNGFIIAVNGHNWLHSQKLIPCGLLLTCLSISRFLVQGLLLMNQCVYLISPKTYEFSCAEQIMNMAWNYCNMASFSCDTTLHVFYCLKVTTFARPPFPWLKSRIDRLVPRLLTIPCVAFVVLSLPSYVDYVNGGKCGTLTGNLTEHRNLKTRETFSKFAPVQFTLPTLCFIICLAASLLLFISLWRHTRNMRENGLDTKDLSTRAHLNVMKSLLGFLFFFVVYFVALVVTVSKDFRLGSLGHLTAIVLLSSYPSAHSIMIIVTNPKLKETGVRFLNIGKRFPFSSSGTSTE
uniref:taste receptor type 2 member 7-like n=1 Tax=Euleptes europaea TaxID=460621 RepID=UPI0025415C99|nr:taste receptor type 2 member 7-like [Euleptes europaea]